MPQGLQFHKVKQKPLVLLSPLDWGYGHTTRCIPIAEALLSLNCSVIIACNEWQKAILEPVLPTCRFVFLQGYNISYGRSAWSTFLRLFLQIPHILGHIRLEHNWLKNIEEENPVDGVIADNRYGFFSKKVPSVLITHQLAIRTGLGQMADRILQRIHYRLINRFSACWVPDDKEMPYMAGVLSHPICYPRAPVTYLGCLSRMHSCTDNSHEISVLVLLSGPEPQRSILEKLLLERMEGVTGEIVFVRGTTTQPDLISKTAGLRIINFATAEALNSLLCTAKLVITRSGYTTVMDILKLKKRCILIPTPGQTEQEYLGKHLMQHKWALCMQQQTFNWKTALQEAASFPYEMRDWHMEQYREVVGEWVRKLAISSQELTTDS